MRAPPPLVNLRLLSGQAGRGASSGVIGPVEGFADRRFSVLTNAAGGGGASARLCVISPPL